MRVTRKTAALLGAALLIGSFGAVATADDGQLTSKSMSHDGTLKGNTVPENEHAFIQATDFYAPAQAANGTVEPVEYTNVDGELVDTREAAKPLVGVYINGEVEHVDGVGFSGFGKRDAYGAVSFDDGETWKKTNLSESADESSSDVVRKDVKLFMQANEGDPGAYPGDVTNIFHDVAGDNVLVAWPSKYCSSGQPNYSLDSSTDWSTWDPAEITRLNAIADYLGIDLATASADDLYLIDMYRVAGQQGSVDYTEDKWEQNHVVGEVPYSCLWTARGKIVDGDDPRTTEVVEESYMRWFKAERLTSGRRDVNRVEVQGVEGAGFAITWQEDPDGLRPGQGEGPGEGWSGAIANSGTDIWYSYIDWSNFDVVQDPTDETESGVVPMAFFDYEATVDANPALTQKPKVFVPFSMPMPITDNAKCNVENPAPYCYGTADELPDVPEGMFPDDTAADATAYGLKDMCSATIEIETGQTSTGDPITTTVCVPEYADGTQAVPLVGNTAATRARLNLFGYDSDGDAVTDSAFAVVQVEEDKGLGKALYEPAYLDGVPTGLPSDVPCGEGTVSPDDCIAWDLGKNQWYHSFEMSLPAEGEVAADDPDDGLLANLTFHGHMLNQPEIDWTTGAFLPTLDASDDLQYGDYGFEIYNTEIARRGSLLAQGISAAQGSLSGLIALPTYKQGQMNQGGPADVMSRRIVIPDGWTIADGNPYAFRNMECSLEDGSSGLIYGEGDPNPYYPGGLCTLPAINMSATVPDTAIDSADGSEATLPTIDANGASDTNPFLRGIVQGEGDTTKVLTWHQCPADYTVVSGTDGVVVNDCATDTRLDDSTFTDQSWYNPYEVAKGHRGFLDGDFVMMLYAWSPNWRLNTVGHDRYELYIRRSFDGAGTWTTLPASFAASDGATYSGDGTVSCETYRSTETGDQDPNEPRVCYDYGAGAAEQARNVTQHKSMRTTTLDPRYAYTAASITTEQTEVPQGFLPSQYGEEDVRDPSRYFIVYETGDNTTTAAGEPEPLDLFYSRGVNFGDDYQVWAEETDLTVCYPNDPHDVDVPEELVGSGFCNEFDQLEQGKPGLEASEASLAANPGGEFMYAAWAQALIDDGSDEAKAEQAQAKADAAQAEADAAQAAADAAQAEADAAQTAADAAQAAADKLQDRADTLRAKADKVQARADRLDARADRLEARADRLQTDAAEAKAERVRAKADRVQARADRLYARADNVQARADEAQVVANELRAVADEAQVVANEAQAVADEAQAVADELQAAADAAKAKANNKTGLIESDAMARRVWWIDDYVSTEFAWTLPGTNN
jgi:hypothetical protein